MWIVSSNSDAVVFFIFWDSYSSSKFRVRWINFLDGNEVVPEVFCRVSEYNDGVNLRSGIVSTLSAYPSLSSSSSSYCIWNSWLFLGLLFGKELLEYVMTIVRGTRNGVEDATCELNYGVALHDAEEALLDIRYMLIAEPY